MLIYSLGLLAQALFGTRMIIQWIRSERSGKVISPTIFWQMSLLASFLFMIYGWLRLDAVIIAGQFISFYIYIRNIQLKNAWTSMPLMIRWIFLCLPLMTLAYITLFHAEVWKQLSVANDFTRPVMIFGGIGQLMLNLRFVYQWFYSERRHESVLPFGFWMLSLTGAVMVGIYAVYRKDPVLLLSQGLGLIVYVRNLIIGKKSSEIS